MDDVIDKRKQEFIKELEEKVERYNHSLSKWILEQALQATCEKDENGFPVRQILRLELIFDVDGIYGYFIVRITERNPHINYRATDEYFSGESIRKYDLAVPDDLRNCKLPTYEEAVENGKEAMRTGLKGNKAYLTEVFKFNKVEGV